MPFTPRRLATLLSAAACIAVFGIGLSSSTSESVLRASFANAIEGSRVANAATRPGPVSGSEEYWLNDANRTARAELKKAVSVGDTISLDLGGEHRTLQISKISEYTPHVTEIDTSTHPTRFVMVTARDSADPAARPVRLVMEIGQPAASITALRSGRAL